MRGFTVLVIVCCAGSLGVLASEVERPAATGKKDKIRPWLAAATREPSKEIESAFRDSLKPQSVDPEQAVIRVYDADGKRFTVRKIRFGAGTRDFMLDLERREEEKRRAETVDGAPVSFPNTVPTFEVYGIDPLLYGPFLVPPDLATTSRCR